MHAKPIQHRLTITLGKFPQAATCATWYKILDRSHKIQGKLAKGTRENLQVGFGYKASLSDYGKRSGACGKSLKLRGMRSTT